MSINNYLARSWVSRLQAYGTGANLKRFLYVYDFTGHRLPPTGYQELSLGLLGYV